MKSWAIWVVRSTRFISSARFSFEWAAVWCLAAVLGGWGGGACEVNCLTCFTSLNEIRFAIPACLLTDFFRMLLVGVLSILALERL